MRRNQELRKQLDEFHKEQMKGKTDSNGGERKRLVSGNALENEHSDGDLPHQSKEVETRENPCISYKQRQLQLQLKREEARMNQLHKQRQMERKSELAKSKLDEEDERSKQVREEQLRILRQHKSRIEKLRSERQKIAREMKDLGGNKVNMQSVRQLAEQWGIDLKEIMKKYERSSNLPPLERPN
jgi:signal transduction histidine kinase